MELETMEEGNETYFFVFFSIFLARKSAVVVVLCCDGAFLRLRTREIVVKWLVANDPQC